MVKIKRSEVKPKEQYWYKNKRYTDTGPIRGIITWNGIEINYISVDDEHNVIFAKNGDYDKC